MPQLHTAYRGYPMFTFRVGREKLEKPIVKSKNPEASAQLRRLVQPFLLRRQKAEVLKELPPKEEYVRRISLSEEERKTYCACVQATVEKLDGEQGKLQILAALTRLRQICCDPNLCFENYEGATSKLDACMELCQQTDDDEQGGLRFEINRAMVSIWLTAPYVEGPLEIASEYAQKHGISSKTILMSTDQLKIHCDTRHFSPYML